MQNWWRETAHMRHHLWGHSWGVLAQVPLSNYQELGKIYCPPSFEGQFWCLLETAATQVECLSLSLRHGHCVWRITGFMKNWGNFSYTVFQPLGLMFIRLSTIPLGKFEDVSRILWYAMLGWAFDDLKRLADSLRMDCAEIDEQFTS